MVPTARLGVTVVSAASVVRKGIEVYRDTASQSFLQALAVSQAGKHPANFEGVIADALGHPISGAIVQTIKPVRSAITNDSGFFQILTLPPGTAGILVRHPSYVPTSFKIPLVGDSTRRIRVTLAAGH
jgi:hypothetical protein